MSILLEAVFFEAALALLSRDELFRIAKSSDDAFVRQLSHDTDTQLAVYEFDTGSQFPFLEIRLILAKTLAAAAKFLFTKFFTAEFSLLVEIFAWFVVFVFHNVWFSLCGR